MKGAVLYSLMSWLSPSYPVGAFSHSSGLEWVVEDGLVVDRSSALEWLSDWIGHGGGWNDTVMFAHAHRATVAKDRSRLVSAAELAAAQTSFERRTETTAQGAAFRRIALASAPHPALAMLDGVDDHDLAYPVVAACLAAAHGATLAEALTAYLHGMASNLVSAAQRLVPLGQTDGQLVISALWPRVSAVVALAEVLEDEDPFTQLRNACLMADLASMAHETQYTRLFRT